MYQTCIIFCDTKLWYIVIRTDTHWYIMRTVDKCDTHWYVHDTWPALRPPVSHAQIPDTCISPARCIKTPFMIRGVIQKHDTCMIQHDTLWYEMWYTLVVFVCTYRLVCLYYCIRADTLLIRDDTLYHVYHIASHLYHRCIMCVSLCISSVSVVQKN